MIPTLIPDQDCQICPRLANFRQENRQKFPNFFNAPVPTFGNVGTANLVIVGLAPGLKGANQTGRVFTGDYAGKLLYETLAKTNFSIGDYHEDAQDGLTLKNCCIINAVQCVPPQNKPTTAEILACNHFLKAQLATMKQLTLLIALGYIAHQAILRAYCLPLSHYKFSHGAWHQLNKKHSLLDSYHCSRYNTQTGRLTMRDFLDIFTQAQRFIASEAEIKKI